MQVQQYEAEKYRLEIQLKIAQKAHNMQSEKQIVIDLTTIEIALTVLSDELKELAGG